MYFEWYSIEKVGWLRVVVLGVNDGIVLIVSFVFGVVFVNSSFFGVLFVGVVGLVVGVMLMVIGEYVFVLF